ncbi:MAG: 4Fe-4S dicluster domain-containing protein [Elusimicrobia bacterium]|nr:4Fe-4S dicluster domain-containing protein [Elusimicrobiota bacterium]
MSALRDSRLSRRRFLGLMGATAALASGCSKPDRGTVVARGGTPGRASPGLVDLYATTFQEGLAAHPVLVRAREGRPIHIQANDLHPLSSSKAPLRGIADILGLYDPDRLRLPLVQGKAASWSSALAGLRQALMGSRAPGKKILFLTGALASPTTRKLVSELGRAVPELTHAAWEPAFSESEDAALLSCWGSRRRPLLRLERADVVIAFESDLLSPEHTAQVSGFASRRTAREVSERMCRLYAFESGMSLTGAKADHRFPWKPSLLASLGFVLAKELHKKGLALPAGFPASALAPFDLSRLAHEHQADPRTLERMVSDLAASKGRALVHAGPSLPVEAHASAFLLNAMLGAEGRTVDASLSPEPEKLVSRAELFGLLGLAADGGFSSALFWRANPGYAFPDAELWRRASAAIPSKAFIGLHADETAGSCDVVLPESHWLESWNDFEPLSGALSLQQPAVGPIFKTLQAQECLLSLLNGGSYREHLMARWRKEVFPGSSAVSFERFWDACLHDGVLKRQVRPEPPRGIIASALLSAVKKASASRQSSSGFELVLEPAVSVFDGRYANNGWLQELPHPLTKLAWGNAAAVSPADASGLGLSDGSEVELSVGGRKAFLPVVVQQGQAPGTISSCLGYGRKTGKVGRGVGTDLFPLLSTGTRSLAGVGLKATGRAFKLPFMQRHHKLEGERRHARKHADTRLMPELRFPGHKWAMAVDLSRCVGCQSCVIACQSENNVPVVGPERVLKGREMHWIRVDRYYQGDRVLFEPMFCQQCDDAPCETVCPVSATNHSAEGLNQMAYNRCVGTRYCSNNCPYKVRRFNFFEYAGSVAEPLPLAFNPEVTVRPRGVMEKCTFCVQRIEEGKASAKAGGRKLQDGDIEPACAAACPAHAIVFGDVSDPGSRVSKAFKDPRSFRVLEELGIGPAVTYLAGLTQPLQDEEPHGA